jgi:hypothetical protein
MWAGCPHPAIGLGAGWGHPAHKSLCDLLWLEGMSKCICLTPSPPSSQRKPWRSLRPLREALSLLKTDCIGCTVYQQPALIHSLRPISYSNKSLDVAFGGKEAALTRCVTKSSYSN